MAAISETCSYLATVLLLSTSLGAQPPRPVEFTIPYTHVPAPNRAVRLEGLLGERYHVNAYKGLLNIPYYSYLRAYNPGVAARWPSGEFLGKFVQALLSSYRYYNDPKMLAQAQEIVDKWTSNQAQDGYIASSRSGFGNGPRWGAWSAWEHKYNLLGLLDYYRDYKEGQVLNTATKIGDVLRATYGMENKPLRLIRSSHGGLAGLSLLEAMTYLYQTTGNENYLEFCNYILQEIESPEGPKIISELTGRSHRVDKVGSGKGYEMLSCIIGILRMYQLTGKEVYLGTAQRAFDDIRQYRLYITGTATQGEVFRENYVLPYHEDDTIEDRHGKMGPIRMGEACVTAHWMYMNQILFSLTGDLKYIEEIERSLYNHLLGSQNPIDGTQSYYMVLSGHKAFNVPNIYAGEPPCCISSVMREISWVPGLVYATARDGSALDVLLYEASTVTGLVTTKDGGPVRYTLQMESDYPVSGRVKMHLRLEKPAKLTVNLRVPAWTNRFSVAADGRTVEGKPGTFCSLSKTWAVDNDFEVNIDMNERFVDGAPAYKGKVALMHGPLVLALDELLNPGVNVETARVKSSAKLSFKSAADRLPRTWFGKQAYAVFSESEGKDIVFVPFMDAGQTRSKYNVWLSNQ